MNSESLRTIFTYIVAVLVLAGAFYIIVTAKGDSGQAWLAVGAVIGYVFRDSAGAAATGQVLRIQAAQPTTTVNAGPPVTVTTDPAVPQP